MAETQDPPVGVPQAPPTAGGSGGIDLSPESISDLADAIAAQIAGEALTVNATVSNEVEVKNDVANPIPVSGAILNTIHADLDTTLATYLQSIDNGTGNNTGRLDTVHLDLAAIALLVDGLEALGAAHSTKLDTLHADVDGLETLGAAHSTKLDTLHTDLVAVDGHVDGLEGLIGTTNTTLSTIDTHVDGLETAVAATNTKLDTVNTNLGTIDTHVDGLETLGTAHSTKLDTLHTDLATLDTRVDGLETLVAATNTAIAALTQAGSSVKQLGPITAAGMTNTLYTTGDVIGGVFTFPNAARANGGTGLMVSALLFDPGLHMSTFDVEMHIFNATVTVTDNAAYSVTDGEMATWQGWFKWTGSEWVGNANNSVNMQQGKSIAYQCAGGDTSLYGVLVARGAVTATSTSTDAKVSLGVVRD